MDGAAFERITSVIKYAAAEWENHGCTWFRSWRTPPEIIEPLLHMYRK